MTLLNRSLGSVGLGMLGLDVHTKGVRTLAARLSEYGCDVSYLGEHLTPRALARGARDADVDLIGVSFSSGAYVDHCRDLLAAMAEEGVNDVPVMVGGLIHENDHAELMAMGIQGIFGPGSTIEQILEFIGDVTKARIRGDASANQING